MYYVYVLQSEVNNSLYIGFTSNLVNRLHFHNSENQRNTKKWAPYKLIYREKYSNKLKACNREKFFKSGKGREVLKNLLRSTV